MHTHAAASDLCLQLYQLAVAERGRNVWLQCGSERVLVVQDHGHADHLFRRNWTHYRKNLHWFRQVVGASRITEDGLGWELRKALSQPAFSKFDKTVAVAQSRQTGQALALALAHHAGPFDEATLHAHLLDLFCRNFLNLGTQDMGVCPAHTSKLIELAGRSAFDARLNPGDDRSTLKQTLQVRQALFKALSAFKQGALPCNPLLDRLVQAEQANIPHYGLPQELFILMGAGTDSTEITLGWALYALARQPQVQQRLWHALQSRSDATQPCPLLDDFIAEILRIYPPFPFVSRIATAADQLGDTPIAPEQVLLISLIGLGQASQTGDDPWQLCLEPGQANSQALRSAFLWGPRSCGGMAFALLELHHVLAELILALEFVLLSDAPLQFKWSSQMRRNGGHPVGCRPRCAPAACAPAPQGTSPAEPHPPCGQPAR